MPTDLTRPADRPVRVFMPLDPPYYQLMWQGRKHFEFRKRFLSGQPAAWYVYLTQPVDALTAVIDLGPAVVADPHTLAELAEQSHPGNGASVYTYLKNQPYAYAMPILRIREHPPTTAAELTARLGSFPRPRGFTLLDDHPQLAAVCEQFTNAPLLDSLDVIAPGRPG